jgi:hypothetical protein
MNTLMTSKSYRSGNWKPVRWHRDSFVCVGWLGDHERRGETVEFIIDESDYEPRDTGLPE